MNNCLIHFVGAGPGAADLITVRGMNMRIRVTMQDFR